jgi:hypothetical protein
MAGPAMIWAVGRAGGRCQQRTHPGSERMPDVDQADEPASRLLQEIMSDVEELIARRNWKTDPRGRVAFFSASRSTWPRKFSGCRPLARMIRRLLQRIGRETYDVLWNVCDLAC